MKGKKEMLQELLWLDRKQIVFICGVATLAGILGACAVLKGRASDVQQGIAGEILRFHVIANSDSEEDQARKLMVRDEVVEYMKTLLDGAEDIEETKRRIEEHVEDIEYTAEQALKKAGGEDSIHTELTECYFPRKSYGDCTFPAGRYQALRVCIGKAEGKNWWCVLFPNLCFIDSIHAVVPDKQKQQLENVLTEEEYESLFDWKRSDFRIGWGIFQ